MMRTRTVKIGLTSVFALFTVGASLAQEIAHENSSQVMGTSGELSAPDGPDIIFSNLTRSSDDLYNTSSNVSVAGKDAPLYTEESIGVGFIPKVNANAKILLSAIGYFSGTKRVNLGIYSDRFGTVGTVLPGGEGSTSEIPDYGQCCPLIRVVLPGAGVSLTAGTTYWLVASPDDVNAPTFAGGWQLANAATHAEVVPPLLWHNYPGTWPAAEIRGRQARIASHSTNVKVAPQDGNSSAATVSIFSSLGGSTDPYNQYNGIQLTGNNVSDSSEIWLALPFKAKVDSHATILRAAVNYVSGTKKVNLGIYSDVGGTVGTVLPGGEGSTTAIPDSGECCTLTQVRLEGAGVALTQGTQYWLIASTDDSDAADFKGNWNYSTLALGAYTQPRHGIDWTSYQPGLLAAEIRGTSP
jgi:hypothetical protein